MDKPTDEACELSAQLLETTSVDEQEARISSPQDEEEDANEGNASSVDLPESAGSKNPVKLAYEHWLLDLQTELRSKLKSNGTASKSTTSNSMYCIIRDLLHDYEFWANFFNLVSCAGYVFADYSRGYTSSHPEFTMILYIILAFMVQIEANCFFFAWQSADNPSTSAYLADVFNILASIGYVGTSFLYSYEESSTITLSILIIEGTMCIFFFVSAMGYLHAWLIVVEPGRWRGISVKDPDFWGNVFNVGAASVYIVSSVAGLWHHYTQYNKEPAAAVVGMLGGPVGGSTTLKLMARISVYGDVQYLASALFYYFAWYRDVKDELREAAVEIDRLDLTEENIRQVCKDARSQYDTTWETMPTNRVIFFWVAISNDIKARFGVDLGVRSVEWELEDPYTGFQVVCACCMKRVHNLVTHKQVENVELVPRRRISSAHSVQ